MAGQDLESHPRKEVDVQAVASNNVSAGATYTWTARVRGAGANEATAYMRNHAFTVCRQASFKEADPHLSAIEYFLGALGGDLVTGFAAHAARRGIIMDALEASLSGHLNNPLAFLGVVGETGHAGFEAIRGTLYVSADADQATLQHVWQETLARSPLVNTLQRCVALSLDLRSML